MIIDNGFEPGQTVEVLPPGGRKFRGVIEQIDEDNFGPLIYVIHFVGGRELTTSYRAADVRALPRDFCMLCGERMEGQRNSSCRSSHGAA